MKNFIFTWFKNERYRDPIQRKNKITGEDAEKATEIFMKVFGNLKKNSIVSIQEIDTKGNLIGEPILPED